MSSRISTDRDQHPARRVFRRIGLLHFLLVGILSAQPGPGSSQVVTAIREAHNCPCPIEVRLVATLGHASDSAGIYPSARVLMVGDDEFVVAPLYQAGTIGVFSSKGSLVRMIGRRGPGPGEFQSIRRIVDLGERRVGVVDIARFSVVRLDDGSYESGFPIPVSVTRAVRVHGGKLVLAGALARASAAGHALHTVNTDGTSLRSFVPVTSPPRTQTTVAAFRIIANQPYQRAVWVAPVNRYALEEWDAITGEPLRVLTRASPWFTDGEEPPTNAYEEPPTHTVTDISIGADGLLWVLTAIPDPEWRLPGRSEPYSIAARSALFDWVVEAIDPQRGMVVGSRRFGDWVSGFTSNGLLVMPREDGRGDIRLDIIHAIVGRP